MIRTYGRRIAAILVMLATIGGGIYYFDTHPAVRQALGRISPLTLVLLLALYLGGVVALAGVSSATLRLCRVKMDAQEIGLLTAYSSIINFFGPLQSGPAFRAVYLKKRHNLNLKQYTVATFIYYFFYAIFSGLFLLSGLLKWWLAPLITFGLLITWLLARQRTVKQRLQKLDWHGWYYLGLATFFQVVIVTVIYYVELRSISAHISFAQAIVYAGAANFSLFVSLTPGAIGFRESFLLFSQHLHHIDSATIVAANIIDRAVYITMLLVLAVLIFGTHATQRLNIKEGS